MKKYITIAMFLATILSSAQIKLTGIVKDSTGVLEMANVIALDTVTKKIVSYGFTDDNGLYKLDLKKNAIYNIKISYIGLKSVDDFIKTIDVDLVKNYTMENDNMLDEITIVSKMPVTVKGDTIIYNADSFKNGTERKLEDVLKKLPGVEVNDAGEIEIEGKAVEKVMIDGKDFFDGDTKLATKNIPSNAIDKIQVLRNYGDVNQLRGVQNNEDRIALNIKLKEGKKNFWFGDVNAGFGNSPNDGLYLIQPKLFYYSPKYTINVIGDLNNIGEVVLDRNDIRNFSGGFRSQSPSNGTNLSLGSAGINFLNANTRNANRIETKLSAINFSYSPNEKLDLSGFLIWSSNSNGQKNIVEQNFNDDPTRNDIVNSTTDQFSNTGLFKFSSIYKKNYNSQLNYDVIGRFSNERINENVNSLVLSDIAEMEKSTPYKINQNLSYFLTLDEKNILALEVQHLLQDEDPFYVASLENDPTNNDDIDADGFDSTATILGLDRNLDFYELNQNRRVKSNQVDAKLDYYYILNEKSNLNFVGGTIVSKQNFDSRFFQVLNNQGATLDPTPIFGTDPQTTNDTEYKFTDLYVGARYRLKAGIFTFSPGVTAHIYNTNNTQYGTEFFKDTFQKLLPEFKMIMQFKRSESLTFDYRQQVNFTDVNQIARGLVANDYNAFFSGNADLINASIHNISLFYRSYNLYNASNVFARVSYTKTIDQISTDFNFVPGSVVSIRTNLNSPFDNETFTALGRIGKTFKKIKTSLGGNFNYSKNFQFLQGNVNENVLYNHSYTTSIGTNFTKAPNVSLRYRLSFTDQISSNRDEFNTVTHVPSFNFDAYIWDSLTFKSDFSFNEVKQNGNVTNSFKIWDMTLAYRKNRDAKWEYELVGSNLLGTDSRTSVSVNNISRSIRETFILPRFISLRLRYQL
ncbi:MAG: Uncharacterised protein [Flavobacterium sp. SCGC AAA160-P02]|nr:MAG: Uncharacterised protein [Flavobacterium sp. SCGC AAA160-P02]